MVGPSTTMPVNGMDCKCASELENERVPVNKSVGFAAAEIRTCTIAVAFPAIWGIVTEEAKVPFPRATSKPGEAEMLTPSTNRTPVT